MPLAYSAASVLIVLTGLLFAHVQRERDCAIVLILEGRETLAIAAVQRQRKRLLAARTRERIIDEFVGAIHEVCRRSPSFSLTPPRFERAVVAAVTDELHNVICLLGDGGCSARAIASAERLVEQATSPLYGRDVNTLRGTTPTCVRHGGGSTDVLRTSLSAGAARLVRWLRDTWAEVDYAQRRMIELQLGIPPAGLAAESSQCGGSSGCMRCRRASPITA